MSSHGWKTLSRSRPALPDNWTVFYGFIAGTCSFLLGYALTYVLEGQRVSSPTRPLVEFFFIGGDAGAELTVGPAGPLPKAHQFAAWQYLTLHGANFERYIQTAGLAYSPPDGWTLAPPKTALLVFVPAVLLLAAGGVVVYRCGAEDPWMAAKRGGAVALGYLPLVVLLVFGARWAAPESVAVEYFGMTSLDPQPVRTMGIAALPAALIAGLAYPIAFGSVGGYLAFLWSRRTWPTGAIARGGIAGGITFLIGWGLTVGRSFARAGQDDHRRADLDLAGPGEELSVAFDPGVFQVGTWQFHRLHGGDVERRYVGTVTDGIDAIRLPNLMSGPSGFDLSFVPVAVLLAVAGAIIAIQAAKPGLRSAVVHGATVTLGYLPFSLVTALVVTETTTGSIRAIVGVGFVDAFLLTGLAFPVALGAIGGIIAHRIKAIN